MSDVVGQIALELGIDSSQIINQLTGASNKAAKQATSIFSGMGKKIAGALSIAAFTKFTKDCIEVGSNVTEVQNVVDTAFKDLSGQADQWASNAMTNFGLSELSAKKYMGVFGQMSNAMGITGKAALDMAENVTGLTGDVASFYNLGTDEAYTKLKSIWTGETETLKDLGVVMTQTNLDQYALNNGFGKTTAKMTEQEKVMLRYQYVTSSLSNATGDFVKTQDSWANQTRILSLRFEQLKASLGKGFIALFTPILRGINACLAGLQILADKFTSFIYALTGQDISASTGAIQADLSNIGDTATDTAGNISGVGSSTKKTAKEIERSLASFDKITKLDAPQSDNDSSGAGVGGGVGGGSLPSLSKGGDLSATNDFANKTKAILEKFRNWAVDNFAPSVSTIWDGLKKNTETLKNTLSKIFGDIKSLGGPLLSYFKGPFTKYLVTWVDTTGKRINGLYDSFNIVFADIWDKAVFPILSNFISVGLPMLTDFATQLLELDGTIFDTFKACWDKVWSEAFSPAIGLMSSIWCDFVNTLADFWNSWGHPIFDGIKDAVESTGDVFQTAWDAVLKPVWDNIMTVVDEVWTDHMQPLVSNFLDLVGEFITGATSIYNQFIAPVVGFLTSLLGPAFVSVFNSISNIVGATISAVLDRINNFVGILRGIIQFLRGVFTGDIGGALEGMRSIFSNVFESLIGIVKRPVNVIIGIINGLISGVTSGLNTVIRGLNKLSFDVPSWVPGIGGKKFGFNLREMTPARIPMLAQGGYVKPNTPQLAMIGDNRHQGEVVAPEDKLLDMAQKAAAMASSAELLAEAISILKQILKVLEALNLDIQLDGKSLKKYVVDKINEHTKQTGKCEIIT